MSSLTEYWAKLQNALLNFQFMEESIRMYLGSAYYIVLRKLDSQIPFEFTYKDVKNDSLGKLLIKFAKFNSNKQLTDRIRKLIKDRNHLVHRAYLMTAEELNDDKFLSDETVKLKRIVRSSKECLNSLMEELKSIEEIRRNIK